MADEAASEGQDVPLPDSISCLKIIRKVRTATGTLAPGMSVLLSAISRIQDEHAAVDAIGQDATVDLAVRKPMN
jgi:predicted ABC-class ATPase